MIYISLCFSNAKMRGLCVGVIVFNATFNNISVISWRAIYWWRKPEFPERKPLANFIT
jgi:hypothetical protein